MAPTFDEKTTKLKDLPAETLAFLRAHNMVGVNQGEDAAAILFLNEGGIFAEVAGAACPNALRRKFPALMSDAGITSLRLKGVNVFPVISRLPKSDSKKHILLTYDRRSGWLCSPAQGGVAGGETFLQGGYAELVDEFFAVCVLDGKVTRVVPGGMPESFDTGMLTDDNPLGVKIEQVVRSGELRVAGYHDNEDEGYITAIFTWEIVDVTGIVPLLAGAQGDMCFAWRDAVIPLNGSITGAKGRVQGVVSAHHYLLGQNGTIRRTVPMVGIFQGTQGFMPLRAEEKDMPPLHPTLIEFLRQV